VILAHVFSVLCLALGPVRVWLNARGGTKAFLARRRGSIPGKLPQNAKDDDGEEPTEELDAVMSPAGMPAQHQHGAAAAAASPGKGSLATTSKHHPVERVNLEWQSICCSYAAAHGKVNILHDVWGKAAAGEMQVRACCGCAQLCNAATSSRKCSIAWYSPAACKRRRAAPQHSTGGAASSHPLHCMLQALLGPSGAGKSTLMDILAQRKTVGYLSGFLLVNGQPANERFVRKTAYVPQVRALPQVHAQQRACFSTRWQAPLSCMPCSAVCWGCSLHSHNIERMHLHSHIIACMPAGGQLCGHNDLNGDTQLLCQHHPA
jgi:hypothetical protein